MKSHSDRATVFSRKGISNCKECPFNSHPRVCGGTFLNHIGKVVLVAEAPGGEEAKRRMPFVGKAGEFLKNSTSTVGYTWASTYQMNVINCRPPANAIYTPAAVKAINNCRPGFMQELEFTVEMGAKVFVALGQTALNAFNVTDASITKARGSVYEKMIGTERVFIIPTYHPSYILRGNMREESTFLTDLQKAQQIARNGWEKPVEAFEINPTYEDVYEFWETVEKENATLAVDIETAGGFGPDSYTKMVGFAIDEERALCIPITKQGGGPYWDKEDYYHVRVLMKKLLKQPTIWQNCLFDVPRLRKDGFDITNIAHDLMLVHHALHPELAHNLAYIVSTYGKTPYWKDAREMSFKAAEAMNDDEFRTYNLRDVVVLHQCLPGLYEEAKEEGVLWAYEQNMKLIPVVEHIQENGLLLDEKQLKTYTKELKAEQKETREKITSLGVSPHLNLKSVQDKVFFFYGKLPPSKYADALVVQETSKRTDTKKYTTALNVIDAFEKTEILRLPDTFAPPETKGKDKKKSYKTDEAAIDSMFRSIRNRLAAIEKIQKPTRAHQEEKAGLERSYAILELYTEYQKVSTQIGLYTKFPVDSDGRVKGRFVIHGTATGRLSSRDPNMQNITKKAKDIFISTPGYTFIEADYSNLELRVLAEISNDDVLRDIFKRGLNVHDENTKALFGVTPDDPKWDDLRRAAKTYIFGRNYGGSVKGIYAKVSKQVPQMKLTFTKFREADMRYRRKHPAYDMWKNNIEETVTTTRTLLNAFGRRRIFLGTYREIKREGLNFPIQSTAADILNIAICKLLDHLPKWARIVTTVHDSIVLEVKDDHIKEGITFLKNHMEATYDINNNTVNFPVDIHVGKRLGSLEEVK